VDAKIVYTYIKVFIVICYKMFWNGNEQQSVMLVKVTLSFLV